MLAKLGPAPEGAGWAVEMKWDGQRAIGVVEVGAVHLFSRNGNDISRSYPELAGPLRELGRAVVLDGEIVAVDRRGRPSFSRLQRRMQVQRPTPVLLAEVPAAFYVFDLLELDGARMTARTYLQRRAALEGLELVGPRVQAPPYWTEVDGPTMLALSRTHGLEGIVSKRLDSTYRPGRSPAWVKTPLRPSCEAIILGWIAGSGGHRNTVGSLILGAHDNSGALVHIGHVGTGFSDSYRRALRDQLATIERPTSPLEVAAPAREIRGVHWVEPLLVCEVDYRECTGGSLRHPSWKGLRDMTPGEVRVPGFGAAAT